jgi:hypothetical protein
VFHNLSFATALNSALVILKSLLDLYARLIGKLLVPNGEVFGFNSADFRGRKKLAGGRFLNWVERSTPASFSARDEFVGVFLRHLSEWLDRAVEYRDNVVHDGVIPGLTEVTAALDKPIESLTEADLRLPRMPDGTDVTVYCDALVTRTRDLLFETLSFLPDMDFSLLLHGQRSIR